jgi:hypothetical protein
MGEREETAGEAVQGLTGEPGSVMLVRPVPPQRASIARRLLAAHPVPLGSGLEPGFAGPGVAVWELCDPAAGDEPPLAVVATRPHELGAVELVGAAVVPGGATVTLLRRLFADVAAALRPVGYPVLIACVPRAEAAALASLTAAGFAAQPRFDGQPPGLRQGLDAAPDAARPEQEPPAYPSEAGQRDALWFTMEL